MILHCDITDGIKGLYSILTINPIQDQGILLIFEMCAVIASNFEISGHSLSVTICTQQFDFSSLEIVDIQQNAVLFSSGVRGHTSIYLTEMLV